MALYSLSIKCLSRKQGKKIMHYASYLSGEKLHDNYYGEVHDYTRKGGVVYNEILLPPDAPEEFNDRCVLWNSVEFSEKRNDSRLAREILIALPNDDCFSRRGIIHLARRFAKDNFVSCGMCADIAIHDKGDGNPHAHILLTTRKIEPGGFGLKNRNWDKRAFATQWRKHWAELLNDELMRKGLERVSHESYAAQGIDREPMKHLGRGASYYAKRGIKTERSIENQAIIKRNKEQVRQREFSRIWQHQISL